MWSPKSMQILSNVMKMATQDFFDLLRLVYTKQMDQENQKREFDREAVKLVYEITKIEALLKLLEESQGDVKVCEAWNEMMEEARTIGMNKGLKEGIEKGMEQVASNKEREMYQVMMNNGFSIEKIADIFSVSVESIEKLLS